MTAQQVVVITGAGSGLGAELSRAFAETGALVMGIGRSADKLTKVSENIQGHFEPYAADVAHAQEISKVIESIVAKHGKIDIVFNNAAVYPKVNFLEESAEAFADAMGINVNGVANVCKAVLPSMIKNEFGRIFNLGSWADLGPIPESAVYATSKGAMHALTKAIAADIQHLDLDIEVHEWIPGHMNTQMSEFTGMDPAICAGWGVELASKPHASTKNCIYEQNWEWQPPKGLKQKVKDKILFWK